METRGFIFDLDGVIVDTAKYHFLAWKKLANDLGIDFSHEQNEQLKGVSRVQSLKKILSWGDITLTEQQFEELMSKKNDDYLNYIAQMDTDEILPDVSKVLDFLMNREVPIALGSASKNARAILEKVNLIKKFKAIVDGNDVSRAKPDPEVFINAAERLGVPNDRCIVFEDSVAGIEAAKRAKMLAIGIGDKEILKEADFVFKDFTEISQQFISNLLTE